MTQGKISGKKVNLRDGPGMKSRVLGALGTGTELEILEERGEWLKVGLTGFVHRKFVKKVALPLTPALSPKGEGGNKGEVPTEFLWQDEALKTLSVEPSEAKAADGNARQKKLAETYNQYGNLLQNVSDTLDMDVGVALAVICVESGGVGFKDGRMIIRFEPHWFHKLWGKANQDDFDKHFQFTSWKGSTHFYRETEEDEWKSFHGNQGKEWSVFELACGLDDEAAKKSISMGLGQIMGFNHKQIGYETVQAMFDNFNSDVRYQILGIFDFMTSGMKKALAGKNYVTFAKAYNGSGQAATYGKMIADNVSEWVNLTS